MPLITYNGQTIWVANDPPAGYTYPATGRSSSPQPVPIAGATTGTPPAPVPQPLTTPLTPQQAAYNSSLQQYQSQRKQLFQQYGLLENGQIDPNNQYGQTRQLLDRYGQQLELARMANAGRGIGTHGLANQRDKLIRHLLGGASYALTTDFLGKVAGIDFNIGRLGAQYGSYAPYTNTPPVFVQPTGDPNIKIDPKTKQIIRGV